MAMLEIKNLHVTVEGKEILRGIDLTVNAGEVHAIMGPNGSGKSTLAQVIAGRDLFDVTEGEILFEGKNLPCFPIPCGNSWRLQYLFPTRGSQRHPQVSRGGRN